MITPVAYAWEHDAPEHLSPPEVARLEAFLNTVDRQTFGEHAEKPADSRDLLTTSHQLEAWLVTHGLLDEPRELAAVSAEDLEAARLLRDGLRAWLVARQQLDHDTSSIDGARKVLGRLHLHVNLGTDAATLEPVVTDASGALGRLAADLATAHATGTLLRLKICAAPDCRFVYYDHSRSRSSRWCAMETCGNRIKTRLYRQRQGASGA